MTGGSVSSFKKFIELYTFQEQVGACLHLVVVLGQSTQDHFPFKAYLSNYLMHVCIWV